MLPLLPAIGGAVVIVLVLALVLVLVVVAISSGIVILTTTGPARATYPGLGIEQGTG